VTSPGVARTALRVLSVGLLVAAAAVYLQHLVYGPHHGFFDLEVYRGAIGWWLDGRPLYEFTQGRTTYGFTYPPFAAFCLLPLALLSQQAAAVVLTAAGAALVAAGTWWLVAPVARRHGWPPWFAVAVALPVVVVLEPVRETLGFGQVNLLLAALVMADVVALRRGARWAGAGIGLATAVKLTPAVFVLYLVVTRRWRPACVAGGTFLGATLLASAVAPGTSWRYWTSTLWDTSRVGLLDKTSNQSIQGLLARTTDSGTVLWAALVALVLVTALRRALQAHRSGDELVGVTLVGLAASLVSPISWTHHLVWVVPATLVLVDVAAGTPLSGGAPSWLRARPRGVAASAAAGALAVGAAFGSSVIWFFEQHPAEEAEGIWSWAPGENAYVVVLLALVLFLPIRALPLLSAGADTAAARRTARPRPGGWSPR
jgi:alpha-1,2-mannosyltransferase